MVITAVPLVVFGVLSFKVSTISITYWRSLLDGVKQSSRSTELYDEASLLLAFQGKKNSKGKKSRKNMKLDTAVS